MGETEAKRVVLAGAPHRVAEGVAGPIKRIPQPLVQLEHTIQIVPLRKLLVVPVACIRHLEGHRGRGAVWGGHADGKGMLGGEGA